MSYDDKQKLLLEHLVADPDAYWLAKPILKPDFFNKDLKKVVAYIESHTSTYAEMPSVDIIRAQTSVSLGKMDDPISDQTRKWLLDEVEQHCRLHATMDAVIKATEDIAEGNLESIVDPIKEAVLLGLNRNLGIDYFEDPKARLKKMLENDLVPTGYRDMDELLFGGIDVGGINIVAANSGGGKSLFLANMGLTEVERGGHVLYISLELSESRVAKRMDGMLTGVPTKDIFSEIDKVSNLVKLKARTSGNMYIKWMPPQSTVTEIEAYLREFMTTTGIKPTMVLVDYLDLIAPKDKRIDMNNVWAKDKFVTEDIRTLMHQYNLLCWTASQLNRDAVSDDNHHQGQIAGGISKVNTADVVLTLYTNPMYEEHSLLRAKFLKTRNSSGVGKTFYLGYNDDTRRFHDADLETIDKIKLLEGSTKASKSAYTEVKSSGAQQARIDSIKKRINKATS